MVPACSDKNEKMLDQIVQRHGRMVARRAAFVETLRAQAAALEQAAGPVLPTSDDLSDCAADTACAWAEQVRAGGGVRDRKHSRFSIAGLWFGLRLVVLTVPPVMARRLGWVAAAAAATAAAGGHRFGG